MKFLLLISNIFSNVCNIIYKIEKLTSDASCASLHKNGTTSTIRNNLSVGFRKLHNHEQTDYVQGGCDEYLIIYLIGFIIIIISKQHAILFISLLIYADCKVILKHIWGFSRIKTLYWWRCEQKLLFWLCDS